MSVDAAMIRRFETLGPQSTLDDASAALIRTTQHEFPVVDGGGILRGFLTRQRMVAALAASGPQHPVLEAMIEVPAVRAGAPLSAALDLMRSERSPIVAVTDAGGRFIGYVNQENLGELLMVSAGREKAAAR
jgi:stage IV sporulation protein FB